MPTRNASPMRAFKSLRPTYSASADERCSAALITTNAFNASSASDCACSAWPRSFSGRLRMISVLERRLV